MIYVISVLNICNMQNIISMQIRNYKHKFEKKRLSCVNSQIHAVDKHLLCTIYI